MLNTTSDQPVKAHADVIGYLNCAIDVAHWNFMGMKGNEYPDHQNLIPNQLVYIQSEAKEIEHGLYGLDAKEVIDGVADVFVTASYLVVLQGNHAKRFDILSNYNQAIASALTQVNDLEISVEMDFEDLLLKHAAQASQSFMHSMVLCFLMERMGVDMVRAIQDVMTSNWTKYPKITDLTRTPEEECSWIETNRLVDNVKPINVKPIEIDGRLVFKNNDGEGKIMKPSCYKDPEFLELDIKRAYRALFN